MKDRTFADTHHNECPDVVSIQLLHEYIFKINEKKVYCAHFTYISQTYMYVYTVCVFLQYTVTTVYVHYTYVLYSMCILRPCH